ncbi:MAG: hypothetical protein ACHQRO_13535 [Vicinamibacteria bacterium]|jgi:uncharacterized membrane protein YhaH (DUF805 family)
MEVTSPWMAMAAAWMPMGILYLLFYLIFVVPPLFLLRQRALDETPRAIWALAIISAPIIGAVAFVILQPGQGES